MPNNLSGLYRKPFGVYVKNSENFARNFCRFDLKFGGRIEQKVQSIPGDFNPGLFHSKRFPYAIDIFNFYDMITVRF
jgi:hypothetical protein